MNTLSANMRRLALEAEVSISDLNTLEEHLKSIHEVVSREDSSIIEAKDELLAQLWTKLGGNQKELKGMNKHLVLLKGVGSYRDRALAHVVAALQTLETMAEEMEELRERVAIPVEVHMKSIRSGLERLKDRRIGAKNAAEQIRNRVLRSEGEIKDDIKVTRV
jgi:chromosome segregation ATPase